MGRSRLGTHFPNSGAKNAHGMAQCLSLTYPDRCGTKLCARKCNKFPGISHIRPNRDQNVVISGQPELWANSPNDLGRPMGSLSQECFEFIVKTDIKCRDPLFRVAFGASTFTISAYTQQLSIIANPPETRARFHQPLENPPEPLQCKHCLGN